MGGLFKSIGRRAVSSLTVPFSKILRAVHQSGPALVTLLAALALTGGFSEFASCAISAISAAILLIAVIRNRHLELRVNLISVVIFIIWQFYLISSLYAVDAGMALIGFVKFLPVVLFMILLMQKSGYAEGLRFLLPYIAVALGLLSLLFMCLGVAGFSVEGRLAGFFQYPNTFAAFLMLGALTGLSRTRRNLLDFLCAGVLIWLILLTQSRAVFVLTAVFTVLMLFFRDGISRKARGGLVVTVIVLIAAVWLLYPVLSENEFLSRFTSLSVFESTFAGRLLYWRDAMPVILRHPFGAGYLGYYYLEQYIQTGVYAVRYLHNDLLQLMLDVGWAPAVGLLIVILRPVFRKSSDRSRRLLILAFLGHLCFDMDLQFTAMWMVLLVLVDDYTLASGKLCLELKKTSSVIIPAVCCALSLYFSTALGLGFFGNPAASLSLYPLNTEQCVQLLTDTESAEQMERLSDRILAQNEFVQVAYSAKARIAFSEGDVEKLIGYKNKIFEIAPFAYKEYEEYAGMLIYSIGLYEQAGDTQSADVCRRELIGVREKLNALNDRLSPLGRIINDQPVTTLPDDINAYIDRISS